MMKIMLYFCFQNTLLNLIKILKCLCIDSFGHFLLANVKDRLKPRRWLFTVCQYLLPFNRYELSEILRKMRKENWVFCAPLTRIVTSQVGLVFIQYQNVPYKSDIIGQNQVKLSTLVKQDEKTTKITFFVAIAIC